MKMPPSATSTGIGKIRSGAVEDSLIQSTIEFVWENLALWRDDPDRPQEAAEEALNAQLANFLGAKANREFPMVQFQHEQRQTGQRRVDLSAKSTAPVIICGTYYSIYRPFTVIEGKRLPAPDPAREKEYVTGGEKRSGGIQRFKLGLHGADHEKVMIIGYIQKGNPQGWKRLINQWILDRAASTHCKNEHWSITEKLPDLIHVSPKKTSRTTSLHSRKGGVVSPNLEITHLWIEMTTK